MDELAALMRTRPDVPVVVEIQCNRPESPVRPRRVDRVGAVLDSITPRRPRRAA